MAAPGINGVRFKLNPFSLFNPLIPQNLQKKETLTIFFKKNASKHQKQKCSCYLHVAIFFAIP